MELPLGDSIELVGIGQLSNPLTYKHQHRAKSSSDIVMFNPNEADANTHKRPSIGRSDLRVLRHDPARPRGSLSQVSPRRFEMSFLSTKECRNVEMQRDTMELAVTDLAHLVCWNCRPIYTLSNQRLLNRNFPVCASVQALKVLLNR